MRGEAAVARGVREGLSEKVTFLRRPSGWEGAAWKSWGIGVPGEGSARAQAQRWDPSEEQGRSSRSSGSSAHLWVIQASPLTALGPVWPSAKRGSRTPSGADRLLPSSLLSCPALFCINSRSSSWAILPFPFRLNQRGYFGKSYKRTKPWLAFERI